MQVRLLQSSEELARLSPVLRQLRPQFGEEDLIAAIERQRQHGYQLAYVEGNGRVLCVAGFVIAHKLAWGKHLYVDDLVTEASARSLGAGKLLLDWLKEHARRQDCAQFHLDSGVQRHDAHRFYFREGLTISSHHFCMQTRPAESP